MLAYKFDISRITQRIKDYLKGIDSLLFLNEFREYLLLELISEFELPINVNKSISPVFNNFKSDLLNNHFNDFACTYYNMYKDIITILDTNVNYFIESIVVSANILTLKLRK